MTICVFGLGAVGGLIAARLARAGVPVTGVARGATLAAVRKRGGLLLAEGPDGEPSAPIPLTVTGDPAALGGFASACMREAAEVGARIGLPISTDPEERHAVSRGLGAVRTSILQDAEAGRPVELDALVAAVTELGREVGVPTPSVDALLGLARLNARVRGLYPDA